MSYQSVGVVKVKVCMITLHNVTVTINKYGFMLDCQGSVGPQHLVDFHK